jgi:hypothetical protein
MKSETLGYCLTGHLKPKPEKAAEAAIHLKDPQLKELRKYCKKENVNMMGCLSIYARLQARQLQEEETQQAELNAVALEMPQRRDMDNSLLSEVLIRPSWLGKRQLEPQDVLNFLTRTFVVKKAITAYERNMNSVVMIGREEMMRDDRLHTRPLSDSRMLVWERAKPNSPFRAERLQCAFHPRFPFTDQDTVQRDLSVDSATIEPAFFGTGFFFSGNMIATAGHVVTAMRQARAQNPNASFIAVQYHRLRADKPVRMYRIRLNDIMDMHGQNTLAEDWAYLNVEGRSDHFIRLKQDAADCGREVYGLGHGLGLPLKMAWNGLLFKSENNIFRCKLETFGGNSGSPIFCAQTHKVIGILSGNDGIDYQVMPAPGEQCYVMPKVYLNGYNGAVCTSIGRLVDKLLAEGIISKSKLS